MDTLIGCSGCRYGDLDGDMSPCSGCSVNFAGLSSYWAPKRIPTDVAMTIPASDSPKHSGGPVLSDGGSSTYYFLPKDATELNDLIEFKRMSFARANIFKAIYRMGEKVGTDVIYDINKIELFCQRLRGMVEKGIPL